MKKINKILVGAAFSPNLKANIIQACRFANYFNAKLYVVHIGVSDQSKSNQLDQIVADFDYKGEIEYVFKEGDPVKILSKVCDENKVDLLILGAQKRENIYKHYVGTVAKKLTRKVNCSVMLLRNQSKREFVKKHVVINGVASDESEKIINISLYVAHYLTSNKVTIVEEIENKESKVDDEESLQKAVISHDQKVQKEDLRINNILKSVDPQYQDNLEIKTQGIFGRSGYAIGHYARVVRADLLVMGIPVKKGFLKKWLMDDLDFLMTELPTDVLIVK